MMRRMVLRTFVCRGVVVVSFLVFPAVLSAQDVLSGQPLKQGAARDRPLCPAARVVAATAPEQKERARALVQQGQQAAILGDSPAALRALRDASVLDPTDADLAYQLGRAYETAKDARNAVTEYCRFLSLQPTSPDAGEVFEKIRSLAPTRPDQVIDVTLAVFRTGVAAYQRGELATADSAFTRAIQSDSGWADAYYNRGRVRLDRGDRDAARADLSRYLALVPEASDRRLVEREVNALGPAVLSPELAFAFGIVIPGGGQFYTHRPIRGTLTLLTVAAASAIAAQTKTVGAASSGLRIERPHLYAGIAAAVGVGVLSAVDAAWYAWSTQQQDAPVRVGLSIVPGANTVVARVAIPTRW